MTDFGIDVSHFNVVHDWNAVHGNHITFAIAKLTEGTTVVDARAAGHVDGARAAGLRVGGYHFARPGDVGAQVAHFVAQLRARSLLAPDSVAPALDVEVLGLGPSTSKFVADFVRRLRDATGVRRVLVYANLDFWLHRMHPEQWIDADVLIWIARFNGDPGHPGFDHPAVRVHQHSSNGLVPGVTGHVDRDATVGAHTVADLLVGGAPHGGTHTVVAGETMFGIAQQHHTTVAVLAALNHIADPAVIHPGQVLQLP